MRLRGGILYLSTSAVLLLSLPFAYGLMGERSATGDSAAIYVLKNYLQASYARDYRQAYAYISALDRRLKDERSYVRERGAFNGFTLEVAKQLASTIEVHPLETRIEHDRARLRLKIKLPDAGKLGSLLLNWDSERLNTLSVRQRREIIETLTKQRKAGKLEMLEGEESFELVKESGTWKIFLDWAAGVKIKFQTTLASGATIETKLVQTEVVTKPGELFNIALRIRNNSKQELTARIGHLVDPHGVRDHLDLVECGFLLPVRLLPQKEEEFTSTYLLRGGLPEGVRELTVTYAFALLK